MHSRQDRRVRAQEHWQSNVQRYRNLRYNQEHLDSLQQPGRAVKLNASRATLQKLRPERPGEYELGRILGLGDILLRGKRRTIDIATGRPLLRA